MIVSNFNLRPRHSYNKSQIRIINQYIADLLHILYRGNRIPQSESEPELMQYEAEDILVDNICVDFGLTIDQLNQVGDDYESPFDKNYLEWILNNYEPSNTYKDSIMLDPIFKL